MRHSTIFTNSIDNFDFKIGADHTQVTINVERKLPDYPRDVLNALLGKKADILLTFPSPVMLNSLKIKIDQGALLV